MSILTRLFGSKNLPSPSSDKRPTFRRLIKGRTPPWNRVPPIVIDPIFEALDDTELFDCFVRASMENKLVTQYEQLGQDDENVSIVRAQLSDVLCKTGFRQTSKLERELANRQIESARATGLSAMDLFEPSIAMSRDQIVSYIGIAHVYNLLGVKSKSEEYAERGLAELERVSICDGSQA
jgi:hypothetical protein